MGTVAGEMYVENQFVVLFNLVTSIVWFVFAEIAYDSVRLAGDGEGAGRTGCPDRGVPRPRLRPCDPPPRAHIPLVLGTHAASKTFLLVRERRTPPLLRRNFSNI